MYDKFETQETAKVKVNELALRERGRQGGLAAPNVPPYIAPPRPLTRLPCPREYSEKKLI